MIRSTQDFNTSLNIVSF